ncbi:MAG: T9SS type A sorting domain-containing protein [Bacteroidetes bacterium]|nr:T9SS type A sorting domain-containing protein [Bacteroidota bacterium]
MKKLITLISIVACLNPVFSFCQQKKVHRETMDDAYLPGAHENKKQLHSEKLDNPYLPNAFNNQKTSPAYKFTGRGKTKLQVNNSNIFTIQVNVNGSGQNISGDAGNEPNIALNPASPNEIVIGWRQFDNVSSNFRQAGWSYSSNAGTSWTFPGKIEAGVFRSDPVLDYDSNGKFYYNSLTNSFACKVFISTNGGASWNTGTNAGGGDKQWMAIDRTAGVGSGNIYSFWTSSYSTCLPGYFTRSTNGGNSYENCTDATDSSYWNSMAIGNNGELYVAGADDNGNMEVIKSLNAQIPASVISWSPPVWINLNGTLNAGTTINPAGLLGQANIDVDRSNGPGKDNVYVAASITTATDPADVMFSKSTDGGNTWSAPQKINDDVSSTNTQWMATMSVAPNGRIDIIWLDTRDDSTLSDLSALYYSYSTDQGVTWSPNEKLSSLFDPHTGYPNQNKMGDYFDMESDNTGAHLAWANTLNGEEDVYYSHIVPQTTGVNEISDNASVSIFPNPSSGEFQVSGFKFQVKEIEVYTSYGEKVYSKKIISCSKPETVNLNAASGIYFLKIISQDGSSVVKKIVKE